MKNNPNSIKIEKIILISNDKEHNQNLNLTPGETKKIIFENITIDQNFQVYMNGCNEIVKTIYI